MQLKFNPNSKGTQQTPLRVLKLCLLWDQINLIQPNM